MTKVLTLISTFRNFTNMEKTGYMVSSNSEKWPIKSESFQDQSVFSCHCEQSEQGFLWIVRMTGAWCRLVSWQADTASPVLGLTSQLWTWERVESGVHWQYSVWIFPVSVLAICLPSRANFLQHWVTLTQVQARAESRDGITITKISHGLKISPELLVKLSLMNLGGVHLSNLFWTFLIKSSSSLDAAGGSQEEFS